MKRTVINSVALRQDWAQIVRWRRLWTGFTYPTSWNFPMIMAWSCSERKICVFVCSCGSWGWGKVIYIKVRSEVVLNRSIELSSFLPYNLFLSPRHFFPHLFLSPLSVSPLDPSIFPLCLRLLNLWNTKCLSFHQYIVTIGKTTTYFLTHKSPLIPWLLQHYYSHHWI